MKDNLQNIEDDKSQEKCIIILNDKEYEGTFLKLMKNNNTFYLLVSEQIKKNDIINNNKIDIIYNNTKNEIDLNKRIFEVFNKNIICIEIIEEDNINESCFFKINDINQDNLVKEFINEEKNGSYDSFFKKIELKNKKINKNENDSKSEYLLTEKEINSINENEEFSNNQKDNNDNNNRNIINICINNLKLWIFIVLLIIILVIIIAIICLYLNKYENGNVEDINQCSFELVYYTDEDNEMIPLINSSFIDFMYKMEINNEKINPCYEYLFNNKGNHTVNMYFKKNDIKSMDSMFYRINKLKSIIFYPNINSSIITDMSQMFYECSSLTSINLTNFDTQNVRKMSGMLYSCTSLTSIDFSNFNTCLTCFMIACH